MTRFQPIPISIKDKIELSRATTAPIDFKIPTPEGLIPYEFQRAGVYYSLHCNKTILWADEQGLGKSIQSILSNNIKGRTKIVIICPSALQYNWRREVLKWSVFKPTIEIFHPKTYSKKADVLIVSFYWASVLKAMKEIILNGPYDCVHIDEGHYLKNIKSQRGKLVLAQNGILSKAQEIHLISGTPIENRPIEFYYPIKRTCPEALGEMSEFEFGLKYCGGFKSDWGWDFTGASNLPELGRRLRSHLMIRRMKKNVLKDLPEKTISTVYLDLNPKAKDIVKKMAGYSPEEILARRVPQAEFATLATLRYDLGLLKIPFAVQYLKALFDSGHEKILIFCVHKDVAKALAEELSEYNPLLATGEQSKEKRDALVQMFQASGANRAFIATIQAMAEGHTITAASYVVFVEMSLVPGKNDQAMDRAHRIGQKFHVLVDFLIFENSLDERFLKIATTKAENIREALE